MASMRTGNTEVQDIVAVYRATCYGCMEAIGDESDGVVIENKSQFIKIIKKAGWLHRVKGWLCPDCIEKRVK